VPQAHNLYHDRNRMYNPQVGRFLQPDPNATAMAIATSPAFNGRGAESLSAAFDLEAHMGDGLNVYEYLGSNPWRRSDAMGLSFDPFSMVDDYIAESAGNTAAFMERIVGGAQAAAYIGAVVISQLPFPIAAIAGDVGAEILEGQGGIPPSLKAARKILGYVQLTVLAATVAKVAFSAAKAAVEYVIRYGMRGVLRDLAYGVKSMAKGAWEWVTRKRGTGCGCFTATTVVWTATGLMPIDQIHTGDLVLARDEQTGKMTFEPVISTIYVAEASLVEVSLRHADGHEQTIQTTDEHPFWVSCASPRVGVDFQDSATSNPLFKGGRWVRADALQPGDELRTNTGPATIAGIVFTSQRQAVYNLTVANHPDYHVGPDGVVVHNGACSRYRELFVQTLEASGKRMPPGYEVHHRIPQKYREMFPDGRVDMISNWAGMPGKAHWELNGKWNAFRREHPSASADDVEKFAAEMDIVYGSLYLIP
jgi:hypothetical protein